MADYEHRIWNLNESGFCLAKAVREVGGSSDH